MPAQSCPERDLQDSPLFCFEVDLWENRDNVPWPRLGESLLSNAVGQEDLVYLYDDWIPSELERLGFYAMFFEERAQELAWLWKRTHQKSENFLYPVGFLYRHAIELHLKHVIAASAWFRAQTPENQRAALHTHRLRNLWDRARALIAEYSDEVEMRPFESQLIELDELDQNSDGFRYPFGFVGKSGTRKPLLAGVAYQSFDNFVWVLQGMCSWLSASADAKAQFEDYQAEMRSSAAN